MAVFEAMGVITIQKVSVQMKLRKMCHPNGM